MQRGLVYNKVNPIFHHWRVDDRKFGLTFQSPADAISFEKGLQTVLDKLDRGRQTRDVHELLLLLVAWKLHGVFS